MKRLIVICEGQTEQAFCRSVLAPYFLAENILIQAALIKKTHGGIVPWIHLKKQIENHLKQEKSVFVTTLLDFYGINAKHQFPNWEEVQKIVNKNQRLDRLETAMKTAIAASLHYRFVPYLQLHEFEALLFSDFHVFETNFEAREFTDKSTFQAIFKQFPNPELINDHKDTAPSKRLQKHIQGYHKTIYGCLLAEEIGLAKIRSKNPRFDQWICTLESFLA